MKTDVVTELKTRKFHLRYRDGLVWAAKKNRKKETAAEKKIWNEVLRNKKSGFKFVRQKPIDRFIVDFYCSELRLVIEIDGGSHNRKIGRDELRDKYLRACGIRCLRFKNEEVLGLIDEVKEKLLFFIKSSPVRGSSPEG